MTQAVDHFNNSLDALQLRDWGVTQPLSVI